MHKQYIHPLVIDRDSPLPIYYQLKELLTKEIRDKKLVPGDAITSEMELIEKYQISRTTVRQAIAELVKDGILYTIKGKGTFVAKPKIDLRYMNKAESFADQILRSGFAPSTAVLELEPIAADAAVAEALEVKRGDKVVKLVRLRYADEDPIVLVESYHPYSLCSFLLECDLGQNSLYKMLASRSETKVVRVRRTVEAIVADKHLSHMLKIKRGFPVQHFQNVAYSESNIPVEYCISDYRGDRNSFSVEILV